MPYDPTLGDTTSQVRLEIGDAGSNPILSDDFIEGVLSSVDDNVLWAAEKCARYLAHKYAHDVDKSEGGPGSVKTKTENQSRARAWRTLAEDLRRRRGQSLAAPTMVGTDAQLEAALTNENMPKINFTRGQFDNPANPSSVRGRNPWE